MKNSVQNRSLTFAKVELLYHDFILKLSSKSADTKGTYDRALREYLRWCKNKTRIDIELKDIISYKNYLTKTKKLSPVSISTYLTSLRQFLNYLVSRKILKYNPALKVKGNYRKLEHTREKLTTIEVRDLLKSVKRIDERGFRDFAILKLMSSVGLSEIEIIRANIGDIKKQKNSTILFVQGKNAKEKNKFVILSNELLNIIKGYFAFRIGANNNEPLFQSAGNRTRGKRMSTRGVRERVTTYLKNAGLRTGERKISPFSLRHTAIATMVSNGYSIDEIREKFRIGSKVTAKIYFNQTEQK
ncbi:MAG: tyrosine-type recombinase/integrase [Bacteroidota bacterium]